MKWNEQHNGSIRNTFQCIEVGQVFNQGLSIFRCETEMNREISTRTLGSKSDEISVLTQSDSSEACGHDAMNETVIY